MTTQVLFFDVFTEKDLHFNVVEWCIAANYELLQVIFEYVLKLIFKAYGGCYFKIKTVFLTNEKAVTGILM